jgi:hypothetical protein
VDVGIVVVTAVVVLVPVNADQPAAVCVVVTAVAVVVPVIAA